MRKENVIDKINITMKENAVIYLFCLKIFHKLHYINSYRNQHDKIWKYVKTLQNTFNMNYMHKIKNLFIQSSIGVSKFTNERKGRIKNIEIL